METGSRNPEESGISVTVNGVLENNGDVDGYSISLEQGQTIVAAVDANAAFGSPMDGILQIISHDGFVLAENHDSIGLDPRLAFTAPEANSYVVRLFAFPAEPNQSIHFHGGKNYVYRLTLTTGPYVASAQPLAVALESTCEIELLGWNMPKPLRVSASIKKLNTHEVSAASLPQFGEQEHIAITPKNIPGRARVLGIEGANIVIVEDATKERPVTVTLPTIASGCIAEKGQQDHFSFHLEKDEVVAISVEAPSFHSFLTPCLALTGPDGNHLLDAGQAGAAEDLKVTYTAKATGEFRLAIGDRYQHGDWLHPYRVSIGNPLTDVQLSIASESYLVEPTATLEIPVTIMRQSGNLPQPTLRIQAIDLPLGVASSVEVSNPSDDSAGKVTLKLQTEGKAFSGPIRIRASSEDGQLSRFARTPPKFGTRFEYFWLTAKGKPGDSE